MKSNLIEKCFYAAVLALCLSASPHANAESGSGAEEHGVFSQKGGMLLPGDRSVYLRTDDEWTGFSTLYLGFRYGAGRVFNFAVEGAASPIPHVYLGGLLTYWNLFESEDKSVFVGLRTQTGYRYQDSDLTTDKWRKVVGDNYLKLKRNGVYLVADFTLALRFGREKRHCFYYTVYPRADIDFVDDDNRVYVLISPATVGYEKRLRTNPNWSIAVEAGYAFPVPWGSIKAGQWVNFPSLANTGLYFRW